MVKFTDNRKAFFDYEILEKYTSGIELTGQEVKSVKNGHCNLQGSFVVLRLSTRSGQAGKEAYITSASIPAYQPKNAPLDYDPERPRKLLLNKKELIELEKAEGTKGLTVVPLSMYSKGRFIKVDIAIARGKKKYDKRQAIKKRDTERDLGRTL